MLSHLSWCCPPTLWCPCALSPPFRIIPPTLWCPCLVLFPLCGVPASSPPFRVVPPTVWYPSWCCPPSVVSPASSPLPASSPPFASSPLVISRDMSSPPLFQMRFQAKKTSNLKSRAVGTALLKMNHHLTHHLRYIHSV